MKIIVHVNHPAHVHFFKHFIWVMKNKGHKVHIIASEKDLSYQLLDAYKLEYYKLGNYGKSIFEKISKLIYFDIKGYNYIKKFNPDICLGLGSIRNTHIAYALQKPSITFTDTEHSWEQRLLYVHFTDLIYTPTSFNLDLGIKHRKYNGYHELAYLHPKYFNPDSSVLEYLGLNKYDKYFVLRLISWNATHDIGKKGILNKKSLISELEKYGHVFTSTEIEKYDDLSNIPIEKMHDLLYYATMYIGEGGTMATEAALLGTPSIYISTLANKLGNFKELEEKYDLLYSFANETEALEKIRHLLSKNNLKQIWHSKRNTLLQEKIDVTSLMIDIVENYFT
jgi:predicted glycosyltransferase